MATTVKSSGIQFPDATLQTTKAVTGPNGPPGPPGGGGPTGSGGPPGPYGLCYDMTGQAYTPCP